MSSERTPESTVSETDSDVKKTPFHAEVASQWAPPTKVDTVKPVDIDFGPDLGQVFEKFSKHVTPPAIALLSGVTLYEGMDRAEKLFGEGPELISKKIAGVKFTGHETALSAAKFLALPVATAAAYSFSRDFHSLTHSSSVKETLKDSAALVADSLTIAGAASTFVPKVRLFSTAMQFVGLSSRAFLGNLNQESNLSNKSE